MHGTGCIDTCSRVARVRATLRGIRRTDGAATSPNGSSFFALSKTGLSPVISPVDLALWRMWTLAPRTAMGSKNAHRGHRQNRQNPVSSVLAVRPVCPFGWIWPSAAQDSPSSERPLVYPIDGLRTSACTPGWDGFGSQPVVIDQQIEAGLDLIRFHNHRIGGSQEITYPLESVTGLGMEGPTRHAVPRLPGKKPSWNGRV
jgi:hypothetical protein